MYKLNVQAIRLQQVEIEMGNKVLNIIELNVTPPCANIVIDEAMK